MGEQKTKSPSPPPSSHKDHRGRDCTCFIGSDHHKDAKNEDCTCKIGINHNTKPSPHKDRDGRECRGPFSIMGGKRMCSWCRREETYSPTEMMIIFKKGISAVAAVDFLTKQFRCSGHEATIIQDKTRNIVENNEIVAITVLIAYAGGNAEEWIAQLEKQNELVRLAARVMTVSYPQLVLSESTSLMPRKKDRPPEDFPHEFEGV